MPKPLAQPLLGPPQTAMPNNLAEFSATLWRIAKGVLDSTLTLLCAGLLLAALCVPWRLPFVVLSSRRETFDKLEDFQAFAASQLLGDSDFRFHAESWCLKLVGTPNWSSRTAKVPSLRSGHTGFGQCSAIDGLAAALAPELCVDQRVFVWFC